MIWKGRRVFRSRKERILGLTLTSFPDFILIGILNLALSRSLEAWISVSSRSKTIVFTSKKIKNLEKTKKRNF